MRVNARGLSYNLINKTTRSRKESRTLTTAGRWCTDSQWQSLVGWWTPRQWQGRDVARLVSCYLLLISTPRHTDHSLRAILRSLSESQYLWNFLAQVFGLTIFLSMRRSERISARVSTLLLSTSSCENFHSMARFSGVSSRASESDVTGKSATHNHRHNISNLSKCVTGGGGGTGCGRCFRAANTTSSRVPHNQLPNCTRNAILWMCRTLYKARCIRVGISRNPTQLVECFF